MSFAENLLKGRYYLRSSKQKQMNNIAITTSSETVSTKQIGIENIPTLVTSSNTKPSRPPPNPPSSLTTATKMLTTTDTDIPCTSRQNPQLITISTTYETCEPVATRTIKTTTIENPVTSTSWTQRGMFSQTSQNEGHPVIFSANNAPVFNTSPVQFQNSTGIETWAQNLRQPQNPMASNPFEIPIEQSQILSQTNFPNQNVSLPSFWQSDAELWFATAEKIFTANQIFNEQKRFSIILNSLELKHVKKVQDVVRQPQMINVKKVQDVVRQPQMINPYQALKEALIKQCKTNENERLNILFNQTELGDKRSSELLEEMRKLLGAYDPTNQQTNALLKNFFLTSFHPKFLAF